MYVVIDGAVGLYTLEEKEDSTEYQLYLQRLKAAVTSSAVPDALRSVQAALTAAKVAADVPLPRDLKQSIAVATAQRARADARHPTVDDGVKNRPDALNPSLRQTIEEPENANFWDSDNPETIADKASSLIAAPVVVEVRTLPADH